MTLLGYTRVSTTAQDPSLQRAALLEVGVEPTTIWSDVVTGSKDAAERPGPPTSRSNRPTDARAGTTRQRPQARKAAPRDALQPVTRAARLIPGGTAVLPVPGFASTGRMARTPGRAGYRADRTGG
ncbi:MAG: hypothetical protein HHJ11_15340 [Phycicoccus sp.]|nr:hypothetical protein [Phycicoccus sp.]